jgi:YVTN family beta-propeller protein
MSAQAQATITFLFTDIEGSTRLLDRLGDDYGQVLVEHQRLLREAFAAHGGREIDTQGDAFFVAFDTPRDAVLSAIEGQRALARQTWPAGVRVRVRIGMDTGAAVFALDRYTGHAVHRAARISAAGHGGQILLSDASEQLIAEREGFVLRPLGRRHLKDVGRIGIFQVEAPDLERGFPRLRTLDLEYRRRRRLAGAALLAAAAVTGAFAYVLTRPSPVTVPANSVAAVNPERNRVVAPIPVGTLPMSLAADPTSIWVANAGERTISRIDPFTRTVVARAIPAGGTPDAIAASPGAVWVFHGLSGTLSRINPDVNALQRSFAVIGPSHAGGGGSLTVAGGDVWIAAPNSTVAKVDATTGHVEAEAIAGREPRGVAFGAGALWVANHGENNVYRFDPKELGRIGGLPPCSRGAAPRCSIAVGHGPSGIAVGGGYVWVANTDDDTLTRIDPRSSATFSLRVGDAPTGVAYGDGAIWVANSGDGTVSRVDAARAKVTAKIHVGHSPAGVAFGNGLWVSVDAR